MTIQRKRNSPVRRNSFAVANNKSQAHPSRRRRAHSIAPGDPLSPAAKARRSLAPRKSILKAAVNDPDDGDDITQSMDMTMTRDYREDNPTRKSLGRRVSFANHAHVRLFEVPDHNTNSTASPQSSPAAEPDPDTPRATNDENVYPGAQKSRRRSSARHSIAFSEGGGEESMDMDSDDTGFSPSAFFRDRAEGSIDDEFNDEDGPSDGDDMDVTDVVPRNFVRKRSLSFGVSRQPLANLSIPQSSPHVQDDQNVSNETSYVEDESAQSQSFTLEGDVSQPMEFTIPLIRPPEPPSEAWLALRSATHSGDTPYIPSSDDDGENGDGAQEMELTDAVSRLQAARASLGLGEAGAEEGGEDSFTSTEDSFVDEGVGNDEGGNRTVNVTQLMRRVSLGPSADSTMTSVFSSQEQEAINRAVPDIPPSIPLADSQGIGIYPAIPESPESAATPADPPASYPETSADDDPIPSAEAAAEPMPSSDRPPVFSAPQSMVPEAQSAPSGNPPKPTTIPESLNFTFTPKTRAPASPVRSRSSSPAKGPPSSRKFTAAFAPPITRPPPHKRTSDALHIDHGSQPSPAKRPANTERLSITPGRGTGAVRVPLSPSKTSPLKMAPFHAEGQHGEGPSRRASFGFRRPSGYFAQRKSLGNVVPDLTTTGRISPIKKAAVSLGRKSVGDSAGSGSREDATNHRSTSPTKVNDLEGQEQSSEPIRASPRRGSLPPILDDQNMQPNDNEDIHWTGEAGEEDVDDAQGPQISIEQFFEMTGIRFMDDIAAPRRSIVHPSVLRPSRRASTESQIPLAEYVVAMAVNAPQLELYSHVSKDLQSWVERIKEIHREAEEEVQKSTPPLFQEFITTDESGQAELLHQLKLIKAHNHAQAKSEWYDWKMQWVEQLYQKANEGFKDLEGDAKALEGIIRQAQDIVPALQKEYNGLMAELAKEQAEVAELEGCDQNYLNELKATISEQSTELDTYHADVEEAKAKLDRLEEKLNEVESQKKEVASVVEDAERRIHMQKNSTRAEILQLKDELEALQSLHMWKATKISPELFEFTYASSYCVSIPCIRFRPVAADTQIRRVENAKARRKQAFPLLSALVLRTANQLATQHGDQGIREIVQRLGDYWSSCSQVQAQLKLVSIRFPLLIEETPTGFSATATIMFPSLKAKALISFILDTPVFSSWPVLIQSMRCNVRVAYGPIDRDTLQNAVTARLQQASPINNHACLLDACMEALECFA
ncbi:Spc7 kinetochore protein-domain-containing protein [Boletus edulis]|nr:Spc7 kinetochore protein-domain-containing protein [Boletus edulis]